MKDMFGSPGSVSGLMLRIGQCVCAAASMAWMVSASGFSNYTAFCYLLASMGLQVLWSFGLACLDVYALRIKKDLQNAVLVSLFVVGDWVDKKLPSNVYPWRQVTATLSLGAACSSAGIVVLYARDLHFCTNPKMHLPCSRFEISIAMAFITWFFIAISSHVMFWLLASA
uniref:CASP-like protein 5B2 isoform X1 n=1 Tax=Erigeron canadensis TaxID=72917 RepID=UPI001CB94846|nr:CASP-like protein 5B2 isoform X1 [Erigeron canadensis]